MNQAIRLNLKDLNDFQVQIQDPIVYDILLLKIKNADLVNGIWQYLSLFTFDRKQKIELC